MTAPKEDRYPSVMAIAEPDPDEIIVAMNEGYATRFAGQTGENDR